MRGGGGGGGPVCVLFHICNNITAQLDVFLLHCYLHWGLPRTRQKWWYQYLPVITTALDTHMPHITVQLKWSVLSHTTALC